MSAPTAGEGAFLVQLPLFEGSVDELCRLVTDHRLAAEDVQVSVLTAQLRDYLDVEEQLDLEVAGDALVATARLALLKSSRLLAQPVSAIEMDEAAAPSRPRWEYRDRLGALAESLASSEGRESVAPIVPPVTVERKFEPQRASLLMRAMEDMVRRRELPEAPVRVPAFVRLEAAVSTLIRTLHSAASISLRHLLRGASRRDAVVHFLAVLEIVRRRQGAAHQPEPFGDITIEHVDRAVETASRAG